VHATGEHKEVTGELAETCHLPGFRNHSFRSVPLGDPARPRPKMGTPSRRSPLAGEAWDSSFSLGDLLDPQSAFKPSLKILRGNETMKPWVLLAVALVFVACHSKPQGETTDQRLEAEVVRLEREQTVLDDQLKAVGSDAGRQLDLTEQRELLRSRIQRLKAKLGSAAR
jgi:hypothetical protein